MPNWITNKIQTTERVVRAMLNDAGVVDFTLAAPFPGPNDKWDGIYGDAETAAEAVLNIPLDAHPLMASLERASRARVDIRGMSEDSFRQFVGMLENYRACGYLHSMAFARAVWGTKWNACRPIAEPADGRCQFETAWSCPMGVFVKISERFPDDAITVAYADEDIGSNCGTFTVLGGKIVEQDIAPPWRDMDKSTQAKWCAFARGVIGQEE